ncbi:hypothetical protein M1329_01055 [Candidatus Marsarchaeota archaeon]|nr:hypothetical protein [Candidatus Marsarchaeota archaeon]
MDDYEIIETHRVPGQEHAQESFVANAMNFRVPTHAIMLVSVELKANDIVQVGEKRVYMYGKDIGEIKKLESGTGIKIDTSYSIKYTGGYSRDGSTIYIDSNFPKTIEVDGKTVDALESIGRHHELTEKWFVDSAYDYQYAHEIANRSERAYVESLGVSWDAYSREVNRHLSLVSSAKLARSPKDLDTVPYIASDDTATLKEIRDSMEP